MEKNWEANHSVAKEYLGQSELKAGRLRTRVLIVCGMVALFCMGAMTILLAEIGGASDRTVRGQAERLEQQRQTISRHGITIRPRF